MTNLKFYSEAIDDFGLAVTDEASGYPKENMQDRRKGSYWESDTTSNQNIDIDRGSGSLDTFNFGFLYHNLPDNTVVQIFDATQSNYSDEAAISSQVTISSSNKPVLLLDQPPAPNGGLSSSKRYWRIKITSLASVAQIYLIFMGTKLEITTRYNYGQNVEPDYSGITIVESIGGHRASREYYGPRDKWNLAWEFLSLSNKQNLVSAMANTVGKKLPFFFSDVAGNYYFVRFGMNRLQMVEVAHELYNGPIVLEEEF